MLTHMSWWEIAIVFSIMPTVLSVVGLLFVRKRVGWESLASNNEEGGVIFAVVGTIYAIFLAFLIVLAWQNLGDADKTVSDESATLMALYRDAQAFPAQVRPQLQSGLRDYARSVINDEWATMADGEESPEARHRLDAVWATFISAQDTANSVVFSEAYARLNELAKDRQLRVLSSKAAISGFFWAFLLLGGGLIVGFTYVFGMKNLRVQMGMTAVLAFTIGASLFLVATLDHPYTGDIRVEPDALVTALNVMQPGS
jgi:hypothetical protein